MTLAVLIPYRRDSIQRERIYQTTARLWRRKPSRFEVVYADDGLDGDLFSYGRAMNRARAQTSADYLLGYNVDALPLPPASLDRIEALLASGTPWSTVFTGQRRFTAAQTERLIAGHEPDDVGEPAGEIAMGREALLAVRADVWDGLRGYDERFVGWGPEDLAFHRVLKTVHPDGCDVPEEGLFKSLWHPDAPRRAFDSNNALWHSYLPYGDAGSMRAFYLARP